MKRNIAVLVIFSQNLGYIIVICILSGCVYVNGDINWCKIRSKPNTHEVEPGSTVNLTCTVSFDQSQQNQSLFWSKDEKRMKDDVTRIEVSGSNVILTKSLNNVSAEDSGEYKCQKQGRTSDNACKPWRLNVFAPPFNVKVDIPNRVILVGSSTFMTCKAMGYPAPDYKWLFNGREVQAGPPWLLVQSHPGYSTLHLKWVQTGESGVYTCVANNIRGQGEYDVRLRVRKLPNPVVRPSNHYIVVQSGQSIDLQCEASDIYKKKTTVSWYHESSKILSHKEEFFPNDTMITTLTVHNSTDKKAGFYWCHVKVFNITKKVKTRLIFAKKGLPQVSTEHSNILIRLGHRITLFCTVMYPRYDEVTTSWSKNGSVLPWTSPNYHRSTYDPKDNGNNKMFTFSLIIKNFTLDDAGVFTCRADSKTGHNSTSIFVHLQNETDQKQRSEGPVSTSSLATMIVIMTLGSTIGFAIVLAIRYLYRIKQPRKLKYRDSHTNQEYKYETFISFSNKDHDWVTTNLVSLLEKYTFKYCISRRDFEIGKTVIDNIADSVYQSRTVIAVLSKNYMSSKNCLEELDMALYRSAEMDDSSLIVIRVDNVDKSQLPKSLRNRTFLDYADLEERKHWERRLLKYLLSYKSNKN